MVAPAHTQLHDDAAGVVSAGRQTWDSQWVFILAAVGSAVGFGNIWRFPMLAFEYGGGAFLVPYLVATLVCAIPMVVLEVALGQLTQMGHVKLISALAPGAVGFGWSAVVGTFLLAQYYNALLSYCCVYVVASCFNPQPWVDGQAFRFFQSVTSVSEGVDVSGGLVPRLALSYCLVWLLCYATSKGGTRAIGWLVKLLMPAPLIIVLVLLVRGLTLEGAAAGVSALFTPQWGVLFGGRRDIWIVAVSQVFFSVSAGLGTLTTYSSYNRRSSPVVSSAAIICLADCAFCVLSATVVFCFLGHMAHVSGRRIDEVAVGGAALAFEVFPTAVSTMPFPQLWALAFFLMLLNVGVTSAVSMTTPLTVALSELLAQRADWPGSAALQARVPLLVHLVGCLTGLVYVQRSGPYWIELGDHFVPMLLTIITGLGECLLVSRAYGTKRLLRELALATGERAVGRVLGFWWAFFLPALLAVLLVGQVVTEFSQPYSGFPGWFIAIGWVLGLGPMMLMPAALVARCLSARRANASQGRAAKLQLSASTTSTLGGQTRTLARIAEDAAADSGETGDTEMSEAPRRHVTTALPRADAVPEGGSPIA